MIGRIILLLLMVFKLAIRMIIEVVVISSIMFETGYGLFGFIISCICIVMYFFALKYYIEFLYHTMCSYNNMSVICLAILNMFLLRKIDVIIVVSAGLLLLDNIKHKKMNV